VYDAATTATATSVSPAGPVPNALDGPAASPEEFRAALGQLASGVVLVTAHDPEEGPRGEDIGMTATAFLSVSLEPPMVLVSVREDSRMEDVLSRVDRFAVSILSADQRTTAARFAMKGRVSDRLLFAEVPHHHGAASGAPLIDGALATVECATADRIPAGDHVLVLGHVLEAHVGAPTGGPLTYFRGQYRHLG
jgi:flavin reductase (DIM6/NTAB) family NADH-FMN oxidoreductase RutF